MAAAWLGVACGGAPASDLYETPSPRPDAGDLEAADAGGKRDVVDAAAPPSGRGVDCRGASCALGAEVCCRSTSAGTVSFACTTTTACTRSGTGGTAEPPLALPCDDAADCATLGARDAVCCGTYEVDAQRRPRVRTVACLAPKECLERQSRVVLCGDGKDDQCPGGTRCEVSQVAIPGVRMCVRTSG